jgi:hypothetical protein
LNIKEQNRIAGINDSASWEGKYDIENIPQTGFIAQEVEQAAKELNYDFSGVTPPKGNSKIYSLQYASFVVPLVKGMQEQQQQIELLQKENTDLKKRLEKLETLKTADQELKASKAQVKVLDGDGSTDGHPVVNVVGAERQPFVEASLVEQAGFAIQKFLCLEREQHPLLQIEILVRGHQTTPDGAGEWCAISSCQLSACIHSCQL